MSGEDVEEQYENVFDSRVNVKIAATSKGSNISIHVYQGTTDDEIKTVVNQTVKGHLYAQKRLREEQAKVDRELLRLEANVEKT